jgi:hypothetical protein
MMTMMRVDVQDVYEVQNEKVLLEKRLVFTTLDFDLLTFIILTSHLVVAIRKFQAATNTLAQVA